MFTDGEIAFILEKTRSALSHNKVPGKYQQNLLLSLKSYLSKGGLIKNVCPLCLGNGRWPRGHCE